MSPVPAPVSPTARARDRATSPNLVLTIACVGIVLANLDLFIVNVGLPSIARDFADTPFEDLSWILNGYTIAYAALLVFCGRLAERHRRDLSFLVGVAIFTAASAACATAQGTGSLVAFRAVQAAGAALMTPTSLGLLLASFPAERRSGAVRTWTAVGGFAAALGPPIGGFLVTYHWRWIFLINVPIGLAALLAGWWKLPAVPGHPAARPSFWAALAVTLGIAAFVFAIIEIDDRGLASWSVASSLAVSGALIAAFVGHCLRSPDPFVDPSLFLIRPFNGSVLALAAYSLAFGGMLLSIVLWEQSVWDYSALWTGLTMAPGPLLVPVTSMLVAGRLIARFGPAPVVVAGLVLFGAGLASWALRLGSEPDTEAVVSGMVAIGIGVGLAFPTLMGVAVSSLPPSSFATGSGVVNMIRQAALAVGVAGFVAIIGAPGSPQGRLAAFHGAWWAMATAALIGLVPTVALIGRRIGSAAAAVGE